MKSSPRKSDLPRPSRAFRRAVHALALVPALLLLVACPYYLLEEEVPTDSLLSPGAGTSTDSQDVSADNTDKQAMNAFDQFAPESPVSAEGWDTAERGEVALYIPTMGNLRARQTSRLASQVPGRVKSVLVDVGDSVSPGQALVRIDSAFYEIEVKQRQAELEVANVGLADAELLLSRLQGLWNGGVDSVISGQSLDEAQAKRDAAEARVRQAAEALQYSRERLAETVVKAPYAGVITGRFVDPGELVGTNTVSGLLELKEVRVLELIFTLPQESMGLVETGTPVQFRVGGLADHVGRGTVDKVFPDIDEDTRSFTSRAWIDNSDSTYLPGMLAEVDVLAGRVEHALTVPRRALSKIDGEWAVMVQRDNEPTLLNVQVGLIGMERAEIIQGLREGDRVLAPHAYQ